MANSSALPWRLPIILGGIGAELAGNGSLTATPNGAFGGASLAGHGALTATIAPTTTGPLTGHGALSVDAYPEGAVPRAGALAGAGTLSATAEIPAALAGAGTLSAEAWPRHSRRAAFPGRGKLSGQAVVGTIQAVVPLAGQGALAGIVSYGRAGNISGHGYLWATARPPLSEAPSLIIFGGQLLAEDGKLLTNAPA